MEGGEQDTAGGSTTCHKVEQVKTKKHSVPNKSDFRGSSLTWNNSGKIGQISE